VGVTSVVPELINGLKEEEQGVAHEDQLKLSYV
jgi:hypothetical protein